MGLQEERRDSLATEQDVMVLQLAEDSPQRTKHLDDVHDEEAPRAVLLKDDESSEA